MDAHPFYASPVTQLTAHQVVARGIEKLGGNVKLANLIRLRELTDADSVGQQIGRWAKDDGPRVPGDVVIRVLDALGAIDWTRVAAPREPNEASVTKKATQARRRIERRPKDPPRQAEGGSRP